MIFTYFKVGTKIDLRNDPAEREKLQKKKEKIITYEDGVKFSKKIKAVKYVKKSFYFSSKLVLFEFLFY